VRKNQKSITMKKTLIVLLSILSFNSLFCQSKEDFLNDLLKKIADIKTASYTRTSTASAPGDTLAFSTFQNYYEMYFNPKDTIVGASFSMSPADNRNEIEMCYDGTYSVRFDWRKRHAEIDTIKDELMFMVPFFIRAKSLIEYTLEHSDSSKINFNKNSDTTKIEFYFPNKIVEFIGLKPFIMYSTNKASRYELWIDKNNIPYKIVRKMPHQTSIEIYSDINISKEIENDYNAIMQIPVDFTTSGVKEIKIETQELEGKVAEDWTLKESNGESISLRNLKSKVILMQFTGIGCGPCHESIPFLKKLVNDNINKDFELICIEAWSDNVSGIERYKNKNEINFKLLVSKGILNEKYKIQGAPSFLILDKERIIRKVIVGYRKGKTDNEILQAINDIL
jgi:peroxiredoxin